MNERCGICGCNVHRDGDYAKPTLKGRSHATEHHYVAERFFGRSKNRRGTSREGAFVECPWGHEGEGGIFCYECHEELLHNPVFLPQDIAAFARLVCLRDLSESTKGENRECVAKRVMLLHEVIELGLRTLLDREEEGKTSS